MANALQNAGALSEPSNFAPLHTNRIFTGLWTNRSPLRDAATSDYAEHYGMGRQDSIWTGYNSEISSRLTLRRRPGSSVYNATSIPPVKRFYSFNTFTLTDEVIRVMADTALTVYDATAPNVTPIFTKSAGAKSTYFLGVGNTLYFTNGVDNMQVAYNPTTGTWGAVANWGIAAPVNPPAVYQQARPNTTYSSWAHDTVYAAPISETNTGLYVLDSNNNMQEAFSPSGTTGTAVPNWGFPGAAQGLTAVDGALTWHYEGPSAWVASTGISQKQAIAVNVTTATGTRQMTFACSTPGTTAATQPISWPSAVGSLVQDGTVQWVNAGVTLTWSANIGPSATVTSKDAILDSNGYIQIIVQAGKSGPLPGPNFQTETGAQTIDNAIIWRNGGPFAPQGTAPVQWGYEYMDSATSDLSNMSPASGQLVVALNNEVIVQGDGSANLNVDTVVIFRTAPGGSTFLYLDQVPNPGGGKTWTYTDTSANDDSVLNTEWQAQVAGEGTPLPAGATCLGYHLGRIFAAVGNVVWISSGPDATVAGSSGNAGFDTQLVAQSKITRFWACSLGMVVFTVRDAYIILGSATDADPLYMVVFIENLPLRSYDCFTINKTTPFLLLGNNQLVSLDPSAGIIEVGFPIADKLIAEYDSASSYVTFHSQSSLDTALYVANGALAPNPNPILPPTPAPGQWYRMSANNAPEQGSAWSTKATLASFNMGCVQSVEVFPGIYRLLTTGTTAGPILQRDATKNTDNGVTFAVNTVFGNIVLAQPGQLAALSFVTLESVRIGTRAGLALLLGEISGTFDVLNRTRQDPPILPPSSTLYSDRYHFAQNQNEAWCRHFQMQISWPAEDAPNELLTFTIFGQTWQEMRSQ